MSVRRILGREAKLVCCCFVRGSRIPIQLECSLVCVKSGLHLCNERLVSKSPTPSRKEYRSSHVFGISRLTSICRSIFLTTKVPSYKWMAHLMKIKVCSGGHRYEHILLIHVGAWGGGADMQASHNRAILAQSLGVSKGIFWVITWGNRRRKAA